MGFLMPKQEQAGPVAEPKPLPATQSPTGNKPKAKSTMPSYLGSEATPDSGNQTNKTLLGQ